MTVRSDQVGETHLPVGSHASGVRHLSGTTSACHGDASPDDEDCGASVDDSQCFSPIAIIGMSCRFSGEATSPSKLWELCMNGRSAWQRVPADRFDADAIYHPDPDKPGRHHVQGGHFFKEDPGYFDAGFFNLSSEIADAMDPQLRLLLESVYEASEDAGIPLQDLAGSNTSVTAGCFGRDYHDLLMRDAEAMPRHTLTSASMTMLSNRISHYFDLQGPSMSVDTACSTGLVALHQGCQTIHAGESNIAIIGASCALLNPDMFVGESMQGVLGPEGKCQALDSRAAGYGRGEGVASFILKRFDEALRDGDRVHSIIRQTAVNQDGRTATITSPSVDAQEKLIRECYARGGLDMADTAFVEGHLTGTSVGDPVEAESIARTFGRSRRPGAPPVLLGSVKTNLGHTEPVSGLASLIKTIYVLKTGIIPPMLHFKTPNVNITLEKWNLAVPTTATKWPEGFPRRASVNNFGFGGANATLILELPPLDNTSLDGVLVTKSEGVIGPSNGEDGDLPARVDEMPRLSLSDSYVFFTSGKDTAAAQSAITRLADHLIAKIGADDEPHPRDLAFTLSERRTRFSHATAFRAKTLSELVSLCRQSKTKPARPKRTPRIGYVFNGNGAQWHGMGRELLKTYPVFFNTIERADTQLKRTGASWSLQEELSRTQEPEISDIEQGETQIRMAVVVGALQIALVDLLKSWDIHPAGLASHSMGEIAAAYAVGALSLKQAMGITLLRMEILLGPKLSSCDGGMLAAGIGPQDAAGYVSRLTCGGSLTVACVNSSASVTFSGDMVAIDDMEALLKKDNVFAKKLQVAIPFHSPLLLPIVPEYTKRIADLLPETCYWNENGPTFASPVTGGIIAAGEGLCSDHWVRNLIQPTLFSTALETILYGMSPTGPVPPQPEVDIVVEIGAHSQLASSIRQSLSQHGTTSVHYVSCLKRSVNAIDTMQDVAALLVSQGYPVNLAAVNSPRGMSTLSSFVPDLPSYPWSHNKRYWSSSRLVDEHKFPRHPAHQLLGLPMAGSNPMTPTWRHFLRLADSDLKWLTDHQVDGMVIFPGAGYVAMAIEAARMVVDSSEATIRGYKLRDVEVVHALQIPDISAGVEVLFQMEPCDDKELDSDGWWDFRVSSAQSSSTSRGEATCVEHCRGSIHAQRITTEAKGDWRQQETVGRNYDSRTGFLDACTRPVSVNVDQLFADMRAMGIYHGAAFRNLTSMRAAFEEKKVVCDYIISEVTSPGPVTTQKHRTYTLHPTTLDSAFQAGYAALDEKMRKDCVYVPRSIGAMYVPKEVGRAPGQRLRAMTELTSTKEGQGFTSTITIVDADDAREDRPPCHILIERLYCQAMSRDSSGSELVTTSYPDCGQVVWVPDVLHGLPSSMEESIRLQLANEEMDWEERMRRGAYYWIQDAVSRLRGERQDLWVWNHKKLFAWMSVIVNSGGSVGSLGSKTSHTWASDYSRSSLESRREFLDHLASESVPGELLCRIGAQLAEIVCGHVAPLELMMEGGLLGRYYETLPCNVRSYQQVQRVVSMFAAKTPGAKVLEIGAGTGGATTTVLNALTTLDVHDGGDKRVPNFAQYDFTDVSAGFFEMARGKFEAWELQGLMKFKRLDIEKDPEHQQDFGTDDMGTYDLVVASLVLHATVNLHRTMRNVHKLLRPGGTLVMIECTRDRLDSQLIFGTLPGWWLSEEPERGISPMASLADWDLVLRATGFNEGVQIHLDDCEVDEYQSCSVLVSTAVPVTRQYPDFFDVVYLSSPPPTEWVAELRDMVRGRTGAVLRLERLGELDNSRSESSVPLFLDEMRESILHAMNSDTFEKLRHLLVNSCGIFWATCGGSVDATQPESALAQGLLRTVRQEDRSKRCILLDFEQPQDADTPWTSDAARHIVHVLQASFDFTDGLCNVEFEYAIRKSTLTIPRVIHRASIQGTPTAVLEPFHKPGRDLALRFQAGGSLAGLGFIETSPLAAELSSGLVEIEPRAFGLNFRDVLVALGEIDGDPIIGQECSGVVTRLGPGTSASGLSVGDRVCALSANSWGTKQWASWQCVVRIPDNMSWVVAAVIPIAYVTAWVCLQEHARLRQGESVLVHAATGGFGQAVLTLARHMGAGSIFATCGTPEKRDLLIREHGLVAENIFSSRNDDFASGIMNRTKGNGVDVIINSLAGPLFKASWAIIARNGRFVDVGKRDSQAGHHLDMRPFRRCATMTAVDVAHDALDPSLGGRPFLVKEAMTACVKLLSDGSVRCPSPLTEYSMAEMEKAMRLMQGGKHLGKMVLVPEPDDLVKVAVKRKPIQLLGDATYLIAGGARGVGASIAQWMIEHGAKHLILVSRHATTTNGADSLVQMGLNSGCDVQLHDCDIGDEKAFLTLVSLWRQSLPPIRGIVTGAMVLDDSVLESMTYAQWQTATRPKVNGTLHLHKHLGADVDFFIMLSSLVGTTGNTSQANYAAGNTFQDALARHRSSCAQPAVSLALGVVADVGYVATANQAISDRTVAFLGGTSIDSSQILLLIEDAVRHPLRADQDAAQVLVGIPRYLEVANESTFLRDKRFCHLWTIGKEREPSSDGQRSSSASLIPQMLKSLSDPGSSFTLEQATKTVSSIITLKLGDIFGIPLEEIDVSMPLAHYGVDSLVGVELRNWLSSAFKAKVSIFEILQSGSIGDFSKLISSRRDAAR